jgi:hypothetical protein
MRLLSSRNITSAPVITEGKFSGFVDYLDLLSFMVRVATDKVLVQARAILVVLTIVCNCSASRESRRRRSRFTPTTCQ